MISFSSTGTAYELMGDHGKPALVFIHGLGLTMNTWDAYLQPFAQDYQLLRYDLIGHGQSAVSKTISLTSLSEQLADLLDELNIEQATLIGFSLGGMINRRFAIDHPLRVSALVILNSPHERSPEQQKLVEQRATETQAGGAIATIDATLKRWFTPSFRQQRPDDVANVRHTVLANDSSNYSRCRIVLATGVIELIRPEPAIDKPTLIMTSQYDSGSTPEMSFAIGNEISGSEVIIIDNLQHMGLVEQPQLFIEPIKQFLNTG